MEVLANDSIKKIMEQPGKQDIDMIINQQLDDIICSVKILKNCLIYDTEGIDEADIDLERLVKYTGDLSGYESGANEIILNKTDKKNYHDIAVCFFNRLKQNFNDREIAVYLIVKEEFLELKFHTYRVHDGLLFNTYGDMANEPMICVYG